MDWEKAWCSHCSSMMLWVEKKCSPYRQLHICSHDKRHDELHGTAPRAAAHATHIDGHIRWAAQPTGVQVACGTRRDTGSVSCSALDVRARGTPPLPSPTLHSMSASEPQGSRKAAPTRTQAPTYPRSICPGRPQRCPHRCTRRTRRCCPSYSTCHPCPVGRWTRCSSHPRR